MPNKKSAIKHLRQTEKRTEYNTNITQNVKYLHKLTKKSAEEKKSDTPELHKRFVKAIDKAVSKKAIKMNTAARIKSRLDAKVKQALSK